MKRPSLYRKPVFAIFFGIAVFFLNACLADLRVPPFDARSVPAEPAKALEILQQAANNLHVSGQGLRLWYKQAGVGVELTDTWHGLMGRLLRPHPKSPQRLYFRFVPGKDTSVLGYLDDSGKPTGERKGIHEWNTWSQNPGAKPVYKDDADLRFDLPTMQYFLEMPFRLSQGEAIRDYGGIHERDGHKCHLVYVTWQTYPPNSTVDQYLVWIDTKTMRLVSADFTVRDIAGFVTSRTSYKDFRRVDGFLLPFRIINEGDSNVDESLHDYRIHKYDLDLKWNRKDYAPDPNRPAKKKN